MAINLGTVPVVLGYYQRSYIVKAMLTHDAFAPDHERFELSETYGGVMTKRKFETREEAINAFRFAVDADLPNV